MASAKKPGQKQLLHVRTPRVREGLRKGFAVLLHDPKAVSMSLGLLGELVKNKQISRSDLLRIFASGVSTTTLRRKLWDFVDAKGSLEAFQRLMDFVEKAELRKVPKELVEKALHCPLGDLQKRFFCCTAGLGRRQCLLQTILLLACGSLGIQKAS